MSEILLVVGAAALIILWQRIKGVENQLDELRSMLSSGRYDTDQRVERAPQRGFESPEDAPRTEPLPEQPATVSRGSGVTIVKRTSEPEPESVSASPDDFAVDRSEAQETSPEPVPAAVSGPDAEQPQVTAAKAGFFDRFSFDFEQLVGQKLSIWAGGIALAISGIFLVIYSIEQGLLSPTVRVALSFLFGFGLLAAAELAHRFEARLADPRVRQALAGAGLATLYAAFYLAGTAYGLIGAGLAFAGLAAVTAGAIALSYRYGLPCAILGLVGGFAAPALVASAEPNIPLLTVYLGLVTAGLAYTGKRQSRPWLGLAALGGGFLWGLVLLVRGLDETSAIVSVGLLIVGLGAFIPLLLSSLSDRPWQRLGAAAIASFQMAVLVFDAGFAPLTWGLYLLLAAAVAFLSWRMPALREANGVVAAVGISLLLLWPGPIASHFALVAGAIALISLMVPLLLALLGKGRDFDIWQISVASPALAFAVWHQFGFDMTAQSRWLIAGVIAALAAFPALAARLVWTRKGDESEGDALSLEHSLLTFVTLASAAVLAFSASMVALPIWTYPLAGAVIALALIYLSSRRDDILLSGLAWGSAAAALLSVFIPETLVFDEVARAFGERHGESEGLGAIRWLAAAIPFAALAWFDREKRAGPAADALVAILGYFAIAQLIGESFLPWIAALAAIAVSWWLVRHWAASLALTIIAGLWALVPALDWLEDGIEALFGDPLLVNVLPTPFEVVTQLLPFGVAALWIAAMRSPADGMRQRIWRSFGIGAATIAAHSLYKQLFALETVTRFVELGLLERTLWQAALLAAGWAMVQFGKRPEIRQVGPLFITASLAHFAVFSLVLHNPLWAEQAVGQVPIANLALASYGVALAALYQLDRFAADWLGRARTLVAPAAMFLIVILGLTLLRQIFAGSIMPPVPMSGMEDLLRSLLGIVLAGAFLAWGAKTGKRSWRIGSMVLMVIAVLKVFLIDAAGLEGLLRIGSFMALGFSLIAIGWVYSRLLSNSPKAGEESAA